MKNRILAQTFQMWMAKLDKRDVQRPGVSSADFLPVDPARKTAFLGGSSANGDQT